MRKTPELSDVCLDLAGSGRFHNLEVCSMRRISCYRDARSLSGSVSPGTIQQAQHLPSWSARHRPAGEPETALAKEWETVAHRKQAHGCWLGPGFGASVLPSAGLCCVHPATLRIQRRGSAAGAHHAPAPGRVPAVSQRGMPQGQLDSVR